MKKSRLTLARVAALLALLTMLMVAAEPAAYAQNAVGTITDVSGTANVLRGASNLVAAKQMPILLHDRLTTQPGSSVTIGLIDNSTLHLGENGILTIDDSMLVNGVGAPRQVGLLGGELHAVINGAMRGSSTTFEVHTPNAIGAVRGTDFKISYEGPH